MQHYWNLFRDKKQGRLFFLLSLTSAFDLFLLLFRNHKLGHLWIFLQNPQDAFFLVNITFIFLAWNLFLAWLPYSIAIGLEGIAQTYKSKLLVGTMLVLWLLFFPNAPYLITDLLHLKHRPPIPKWFDLMLFFSFAWTGLMLGFLSLQEVELFLKKRIGRWKSNLLICVALLLCGFGVFLGRFQRWNSWDLVTNPGPLISDLIDIICHPINHSGTLGLAVVISGLLALSYFTIQNLSE